MIDLVSVVVLAGLYALSHGLIKVCTWLMPKATGGKR
jgi:hypothetical protein